MHQGLLILAALYALPPSDFEGVGSRRGATDNVAVADAHRPAPSLSVRPLDDGPTDVVGTLLTLRKAPVDDVWNRIHELSARADETTSAALSDFIESEDFPSRPPTVRFAASALARLALRQKAARERALSAILQLARKSAQGAGDDLRVSAIRLLGEARELDRVFPTLTEILAAAVNEKNPRVEIAAVLALDRLDSTTSRFPVVRLLNDAAQPFDVRAEAALALAQMTPGGSVDPLVVPFLRSLVHEPSRRGSLARLLVDRLARGDDLAPDLVRRLDQLDRENTALRGRIAKLEKVGNAESSEQDAVGQLVALIRKNYVDPGQVDGAELAVEAFRAIAARLDHVRFLSPLDLDRANAQSLGRHLRLGAEFFKLDRRSPLVVERSLHPLEGVPAHRCLKVGDRVLSIDGVSTRGRSPDDLRTLLQGKARGETVHLEVERWTWDQPRAVDLALDEISVPTVIHALFPEGIGYTRLSRFGPDSAMDFAEVIADLEVKNGGELAGFVLDLRDNSGGLLDQAVKIVDLFVDDNGVPIVTQEDRDGRPAHEYMPRDGKIVSCPVVVLINEFTASSAEVVAGALQDLQRAHVVGRESYGKGVSQQRFDTPKSVDRQVEGRAAIVVPNFVLRLPSGRGYHRPRDSRGRPLPGARGGIVPDHDVRRLEDELQTSQREEVIRVQYSVELYRYVRKHLERLAAHWQEGAKALDDPNNYPELDQLSGSLETPLRAELLRFAVRAATRRHLDEASRRPTVSTLHEDRQLQRAFRELGIKPQTHPEYARWLTVESGGD